MCDCCCFYMKQHYIPTKQKCWNWMARRGTTLGVPPTPLAQRHGTAHGKSRFWPPSPVHLWNNIIEMRSQVQRG